MTFARVDSLAKSMQPMRSLHCILAALTGLCLLTVEGMGQIAFRREVSIASPFPYTSLAANSETFVRVGKAGFVVTSTDGLNWQNQDAGTYESFNTLVVVEDRFVGVGDAGSIFTSEEGKSWQPQLAGQG